MRRILPLLLLLLGGCASAADDDGFIASDPATLDCPALARQLVRTEARLRQLHAANPDVQMNIGLGSAIGSHGSIGLSIPVPLGQLRRPEQEIAALEQYQSRLRQWQQQQHCPEARPKTP
ncbi:hypothetical protein [Vogesella oryzae]|uniref:hypothetical protein n=1 Tax=Vogesella oryzae TaxID=1735285 RepID=UPI001582BFC2|nr:hypothetical protein [Vogesella oryzae]